MLRTFTRFILLSTVLFSLSACGGSGGSPTPGPLSGRWTATCTGSTAFPNTEIFPYDETADSTVETDGNINHTRVTRYDNQERCLCIRETSDSELNWVWVRTIDGEPCTAENFQAIDCNDDSAFRFGDTGQIVETEEDSTLETTVEATVYYAFRTYIDILLGTTFDIRVGSVADTKLDGIDKDDLCTSQNTSPPPAAAIQCPIELAYTYHLKIIDPDSIDYSFQSYGVEPFEIELSTATQETATATLFKAGEPHTLNCDLQRHQITNP